MHVAHGRQHLLADLPLEDVNVASGGATTTSGWFHITASMLASTNKLTRLDLVYNVLEPDVLAGHPQLQHLKLSIHCVAGGADGVSRLLSHLPHLQHLTYLGLDYSLRASGVGSPLAAA